MKIIDLSYKIYPEMPVYPGTEPPLIIESCTIDYDGFAEKMICMSSHTGTHIDSPAHMIKEASTLDRYELDQFIGKACVIDISGTRKKVIDPEDIELELEFINRKDFVLFHTGWSVNWGKDRYFRDFPVLSQELVRKLTEYKLKGIGMDTISVDPVDSVDFVNHMILFRKNMIIIENLTNLDKLLGKDFIFLCNPLKITEIDGSSVRACAIL